MARRGRPKHPDILTPREWDVLALLREGCTNEQIAERLDISLRTARFHVSEILAKLEVTSRAEAAAWQPEAAPVTTTERWLALVAPLAFMRRLGALGAGARIAAGGVLAVTAVGVGLLAWGVMRTSGSANGRGDSVALQYVAATSTAVATIANDPGRGEVAGEAGTLPWTTLRISGGDLPHPVTVPFAEFMLATNFGEMPDTGQPAGPSTEILPRYGLQQVRADDGMTAIGSKGVYIGGPAQSIQAPEPVVAPDTTRPPFQKADPVLAALLDRYITLGGALPDRPTFGQSIYATQRRKPTSVEVGGRSISDTDAATFLSQFAGIVPVRFGVRATGVGRRALKAVSVTVRLGDERLAFSYVPPGPVAPFGLLMQTAQVGTWEESTILNPPAFAQNAFQVSKQLDNLMAGLGYTGGPPVQNVDTRVTPLLDADMTMRLDGVTLSDGAQTVTVADVSAFTVVCQAGVVGCGSASAPLPAGETPLVVSLFRRGVDPFPEFQTPAEYDYYPPTAAHAKGILVGTQPALLWNASLGVGSGPVYASAAQDTALGSALEQLTHGKSIASSSP